MHIAGRSGVPGRVCGTVTTQDPFDSLLRQRMVLSPLRYPGGKRRLVPYLAAALVANERRPDLFVEPFAGGASVSLELLHAGLVKRVALSDSDPMVAAFWQTVFEDSDWLCRQIESVPVDLANWRRLKRGRFKARRSLALACLFLNRTSFNGALHRRAGPIGGQQQQSAYTLDCRFPRSTLVRRVRACAELADRVVCATCDEAGRSIASARSLARERGWSTFFYLDPPFWAKSGLLYRHSFVRWQHEELAESLLWLSDPWLLSYDPAPEIEQLYAGHPGVTIANVELLYTAARRSAGHELVVTNLAALPTETRLWRTEAERIAARQVAATAR
jgi:DNA adenine methylase